jgi:hypothetical protein
MQETDDSKISQMDFKTYEKQSNLVDSPPLQTSLSGCVDFAVEVENLALMSNVNEVEENGEGTKCSNSRQKRSSSFSDIEDVVIEHHSKKRKPNFGNLHSSVQNEEAMLSELNNLLADFKNIMSVMNPSTKRFKDNQAELKKRIQPVVTDLPIPCGSKGTPFLLSDQHMVGKEHKDIIQSAQNNIFTAASAQERKIIGIVQPFGSGKPRNALALSDEFIVLPIRLVRQSTMVKSLMCAVAGNQVKAYEMLMDGVEKNALPTLQQVEHFSTACGRMVHLSILSVIAFLNACIDSNIINPESREDRFRLAVLMVTPDETIVKWLITWYSLHLPKIDDSEEFARLETLLLSPSCYAARKNKNIVVVLDEVHELQGECRGYFLHDIKTNSTASIIGSKVKSWQQEISHGTPENKLHCTDLFYQYRSIVQQFLHSGTLGFLMCSTVFRIWDQLEVDSSPLTRGCIKKIVSLHYFTPNEVYHQISRFFTLPKEIPSNIQEYLKHFSRPLYLAELLDSLFQSEFPPTSEDQQIIDNGSVENAKFAWIVYHMRNCYHDCKIRAIQKLSLLSSNNIAVGEVVTTRAVVNLLVVMYKLSGGVIGNLEDEIIVNLVNQGVARIVTHLGSTNCLRIADTVMEDALIENAHATLRSCMTTLLNHSQLHILLFAQDQSFKGHLMERVLALVVMMCAEFATLYCRNCERAGTSFELQIDGLESSWMLNKCFGSNCLLFPSKLAGPDLWYYDQNASRTVSCQSKCERHIYSKADFLKSIKSVHPSFMFSSSNQQEKSYWLSNWRLVFNGSRKYHRVLFAALGFHLHVHYLVSEYNLRYSSNSIILESLTTLQQYIPAELFNHLKKELDITALSEVYTPKILQHDWRSKSNSAKTKYTLDELKEFCAERDINVTKDNKPKKKDVLIADLDAYNVEEHITDLIIYPLKYEETCTI